MHVSITPAPPLPRSGLTTSSVSSRISSINNINDLIVHKAETQPTTTLLAYPASEHGRSDYVEYTAKDLDILADRVAKELTRLGLRPKVSHCPCCIVTRLNLARIKGAARVKWSAYWVCPMLTI